MRKHSRLPTLTQRRATLAKINAAERAMLPDGIDQDLEEQTDARILRAQYLADVALEAFAVATRSIFIRFGVYAAVIAIVYELTTK